MYKRFKIDSISEQGMAGGFNRETIVLPASAKTEETTKLALDIGGSLAKVAFLSKDKETCAKDEIRIELITFNTERLDDCLKFIVNNVIGSGNGPSKTTVRATGTGCMKHRDKIASCLNAKIEADSAEMVHAVRGFDILWEHLPSSETVYTEIANGDGLIKEKTRLSQSGLCPSLFVNIGSAMTIVGIDEHGCATNIMGGSTIGGLALLGLGSLLTKAKSFGELMDLAEKGNRKNVDLLVKDTAGEQYNKAPPEGMVSSFGKPAYDIFRETETTYKEEDIADSLLYAVTDNLAQQVYYVAKSEKMNYACFCGNYVEDNKTIRSIITEKLSTASFYLGHKVTPLFLRHEGYLGVIGALIGKSVTTNGNGEPADTNS